MIPVGPGDAAWQGLVKQLVGSIAGADIVLVFALGDPQLQARPPGCRALAAPAGRARQLNAGIAAARGQWLWLLHADSRLCDGTLTALHAHLARLPRTLGWFRLAYRNDGPALTRINAFGANLRARWLGLPFGDQGFVLHRDDAARLGPLDHGLAFGEDHAWVWRARRIGLPLQAIDATLATSARKYAEHGWLRTTFRHVYLTLCQAHRELRT